MSHGALDSLTPEPISSLLQCITQHRPSMHHEHSMWPSLERVKTGSEELCRPLESSVGWKDLNDLLSEDWNTFPSRDKTSEMDCGRQTSLPHGGLAWEENHEHWWKSGEGELISVEHLLGGRWSRCLAFSQAVGMMIKDKKLWVRKTWLWKPSTEPVLAALWPQAKSLLSGLQFL